VSTGVSKVVRNESANLGLSKVILNKSVNVSLSKVVPLRIGFYVTNSSSTSSD